MVIWGILCWEKKSEFNLVIFAENLRKIIGKNKKTIFKRNMWKL